jgi:hypothetical protein
VTAHAARPSGIVAASSEPRAAPPAMHIRPPGVYVKHTGTSKGRGAYAARSFAAGETVEVCPVILFSGAFGSVPDEVRKLLFNWRVLAEGDDAHCLALGYGSMYNHANPANMRYEADLGARTLRFVAIRDVAADEELTVNYNAVGGGHESEADTWFTRIGIVPYEDG